MHIKQCSIRLQQKHDIVDTLVNKTVTGGFNTNGCLLRLRARILQSVLLQSRCEKSIQLCISLLSIVDVRTLLESSLCLTDWPFEGIHLFYCPFHEHSFSCFGPYKWVSLLTRCSGGSIVNARKNYPKIYLLIRTEFRRVSVMLQGTCRDRSFVQFILVGFRKRRFNCAIIFQFPEQFART